MAAGRQLLGELRLRLCNVCARVGRGCSRFGLCHHHPLASIRKGLPCTAHCLRLCGRCWCGVVFYGCVFSTSLTSVWTPCAPVEAYAGPGPTLIPACDVPCNTLAKGLVASGRCWPLVTPLIRCIWRAHDVLARWWSIIVHGSDPIRGQRTDLLAKAVFLHTRGALAAARPAGTSTPRSSLLSGDTDQCWQHVDDDVVHVECATSLCCPHLSSGEATHHASWLGTTRTLRNATSYSNLISQHMPTSIISSRGLLQLHPSLMRA